MTSNLQFSRTMHRETVNFLRALVQNWTDKWAKLDIRQEIAITNYKFHTSPSAFVYESFRESNSFSTSIIRRGSKPNWAVGKINLRHRTWEAQNKRLNDSDPNKGGRYFYELFRAIYLPNRNDWFTAVYSSVHESRCHLERCPWLSTAQTQFRSYKQKNASKWHDTSSYDVKV